MKRIEWIDHARAFAIFCMVFGHIEVFPMGHYLGFFNRFQDLFCMPLFFFLSGLFAKPVHSIGDAKHVIKKKFLQLIVPFLVSGSLDVFLLCPDSPWWYLFWCPKGEAHMGFWFLLVLFEVYLLFTMTQLVTAKLCKKNHNEKCLISVSLFVWLILLIALVAGHFNVYPKEPLWTAISFHRIYNYFPFFILGYLLMNHYNAIAKVFRGSIFTIVSTTFVVLYVFKDKYELHKLLILPFNWLLVSLAIYSIIYLFYHNSQDSLSKGNFRRGLSYAGRHTLDIYILHYFFLPTNMMWLNDIIAPDGIADRNILLELLICSFLSIAVICAALMCSWIIRKNSLLTRMMLGG